MKALLEAAWNAEQISAAISFLLCAIVRIYYTAPCMNRMNRVLRHYAVLTESHSTLMEK